MWTGLVLAGGASLRMGTDKALLTLGGRTLLERAVATVRRAGGRPLVVGPPRAAGAEARASRVDETDDGAAASGPLRALLRGLREAARLGPVVALAVDLPFVPAALLRHLAGRVGDAQAVVPRVGGEWQVLTAAYTESCRAPFEAALGRGERSIHRVLPDLRVVEISEDEIAPFGGASVFLNVNTPADLERAVERLPGGRA